MTDEVVASLSRWWTDKYNLPTNHPLLLGRSAVALYEDMLVGLYVKLDTIEAILEKNEVGGGLSGEAHMKLVQEYDELRRALGEITPEELLLLEKEARGDVAIPSTVFDAIEKLAARREKFAQKVASVRMPTLGSRRASSKKVDELSQVERVMRETKGR